MSFARSVALFFVFITQAFCDTSVLQGSSFNAEGLAYRLSYKEAPKNESAYRYFVQKVAKNYNIDPNLAIAIMKVESAFNPYAVSETGALGLMQLKMDQAIEDVYYKVYGANEIPPPANFFEPELNIEVGIAYIWLMSNKYFANVTNALSKEYCMIAGYNAGAGAVLRTFDQDKLKAQEMINQLTPQQVLVRIKTKLDSAQGRRYVVKVLEAKRSSPNIRQTIID